jgi:hypothetical protein
MITEAVPENDPTPGAVIAMQTFGDFLGFNPHTYLMAYFPFIGITRIFLKPTFDISDRKV